MFRILVIHFDAAEASSLAARVSGEGFEAEPCTIRGGGIYRAIREKEPNAVLIDLTRLPSYGRWVGATMRQQKGTRQVPIVFLEGDPAKTRLVRRMLPDAIFTSLLQVGEALRNAIERPPADPVIPGPHEVPAVHKLGIRKDTVVGLVNAPAEFALGKLPAGARLQSGGGGANVVLLFVKSAAALGRELPSIAKELEAGRKWWVVWPKKASGAVSDLSMSRIFEMCTAYGLSAHKLCAVDETWSALAVARSRSLKADRNVPNTHIQPGRAC